ncbi:DUF2968 domain-containing protein [Paraburkholderia sp.]|uniref:DUF2968 domain-containing protein n=1 Tax=Paraburkholderia sp. TaxID=1926495 RepID=UPI0023A3B86B|nr:DUF2968 domain-containing protein [Paraburkholderia sp.]MDE1179721.1 DUF2968 domain-containing protein [Paraburkholderia sp.]
MKSLLNRRSAFSATGPSHLVQVAHGGGATGTLTHSTQQDTRSRQDRDDPTGDHATGHAMQSSGSGDQGGIGPANAGAVEQARQQVTTLRPVPVVPSHSNGRAVQLAETMEVEWLAEEEALKPFRVFRTFDYSVSLLFHSKEMTYYVAMYQASTLWRALKAVDLDAAEVAFRHFEEQATRLSEGETRRAQLEAQNEQLARMIAQSEAQAERLRNNLQRGAVQEQAVTSRQHEVRKEVAQLEAQRVAAQALLNKAHRQIHQLNLTNNEAVPHLPSR